MSHVSISSNDEVFFGTDYNTMFDPTVFVKENYVYSEFHGETRRYLKFIVNSLHEIFKAGNIRGEKLLDIGTGPGVYSVISAAPWFEEITLSDYSQQCVEVLRKWEKNDPTAFDYDVFFDYISSLQGNTSSASLRDMVRSKIKSVVQCDVTQIDILGKPALQEYDVITSSLCIDAAVTSEEQLKQVMKNLSAMLKNGGHFVFSGVLGSTFYYVGRSKFFAYTMTQAMINEALVEASFIDTKWFVFSDDKPNKREFDAPQFFILETRKKE